MKKAILAVLAAMTLAASAAAQAPVPAFGVTDPALQDYAETVYGYLSPGAGAQARLRDAVAAPAPREEFLLVSVAPRVAASAAALRGLSAAGFVLKAERVRVRDGVRSVRLVGLLPASALGAARALPGVARVRVLKPAAL